MSQRMKDVLRISETRGLRFRQAEDIPKSVEGPAVAAVRHLWELNVPTYDSSANAEIEVAYVSIVFDWLSPSNQAVLSSLDELAEADGLRLGSISVPFSSETSILEVESLLLSLAKMFTAQPMVWAAAFTPQAECYRYGLEITEENIAAIKRSPSGMRVYAPEYDLFFASAEILQKLRAFAVNREDLLEVYDLFE